MKKITRTTLFSIFILNFFSVFSHNNIITAGFIADSFCNQTPRKRCSVKCDTLKTREMYKLINKSQALTTSVTNPKKVKNDSINTKQSLVKLTTFCFLDSFNLTYTLNKNYNPFKIKNDREFLTINSKKIFVDSLYFGKIPKPYTFRSANGIRAYQSTLKNSQYLFLFTENSSGLFSGSFLLIFYRDITSNQVKLVYCKEQLSEDQNCFGVDSSGTNLIYYEWCMNNGNINNYYTVFEISSGVCINTKKEKLNIKAINSFQIVFCK